MRRFLTLVVLFGLAVPAGISISGCTRNPAANYCNGLGYGQKLTAVNEVTLSPATTGISIAYGQTTTIRNPRVTNCKGTPVSPASGIIFGTTNNQLVDISPTGVLCAGTWNRNSTGGIPNFTICTPPNPLPVSAEGLPYTAVSITASAEGVTSNPLTVYLHPRVTSISLTSNPLPPAVPSQQCLSQGQTAQLDGEACYTVNGVRYELCAPASVNLSHQFACTGGLAPGVNSVPSCSKAVGNLSYASTNPSVATLDQFGIITAVQPGTTGITSTLSDSGSSAGFFSTCTPKSIEISLNGATTVTVNQGVQQNLTATVTDTNGNKIVGLALNYQSTNPSTLTTTSAGGIKAVFPGQATLYATCAPFTCNPAPTTQIGIQGTGLPISSNPVNVTVPGVASTFAWFGSPNQSQYFSQVELLTGAIDSSVRLPYMPNSMVMDPQAFNLYFGTDIELMIYSAVTNTLSKEDPSLPGVVLAVSPDNSIVVINDQKRSVFSIYRPNNGIATSFPGMGVAASFTPDSRTVYIVDQASAGVGHSDALYVYNLSYSWNSYSLASSGGAQNVAITVPGMGAYLAGPETVAYTWCPAGPVGNFTQDVFYPQADSLPIQTDALTATADGLHIIGAALPTPGTSTATLSDIGVNMLATSNGTPGTPGYIGTNSAFPGVCPSVPDGQIALNDLMPALTLTHSLNQTPLSLGTNAENIHQVVASRATVGTTAQDLAFITYTPSATSGTGATLPYYETSASGQGTLGTVGAVSLTGAASITAPVAGTFSPDNTLFFVSTSGDNLIHYIDVRTLTDTHTVSPGLLDPNGNLVPATVITVKPRTTT